MERLCDISYIRNLLDRHGFRFSKSLGQNFLIDPEVPRKIAELAGLDGDTGVVEIGPGIGALSCQLCRRAKRVVAVELDVDLPPLLEETLCGCDNFVLVQGDVLKLDLERLVEEQLAGLRPVVCANLPYNITSPAITRLIECGRFETMTLMVQREVAQRICAAPGGSDYGAFSVFVQYYYEAELALTVPPESFVPAPKVWSAVVQLRRRTQPPQTLVDERAFFKVVRAAFAQRRKVLANSLCTAFAGELDKAQLNGILQSLGFPITVRGEELSMEDFARLALAIREAS